MNTVHDGLEELRAEGATHFGDTTLAHDLPAITGTVRRQRTIRAIASSALTVAIGFALVLTSSQLAQPGVPPAIAAPPAIASDLNLGDPMVSVAKGESAENVARELAAAFGVTLPVAYRALVDALPPEALGSPEGWIAVGDYTFRNPEKLDTAATEMVGAQVIYLISVGAAHEDWRRVIILASIAEQEAPAPADQPAVVRVLLNRLDANVPLAVESVPLYAEKGLYAIRYTSKWPEAQYNLFEKTGLPPTAIGASTREAVNAAAHPAQGDWLFFRTDAEGSVHVSTNNQKFAPGPDLFYPSETQDD